MHVFRYQNFSRQLLKGFEHTWGGNEGFCFDRSGKDLPGGSVSDPSGYSNSQFHAARADPEGYPRKNCENYWVDQTNWAMKWANEAIEDPGLCAAIADEVAQLSPVAPDPVAEGFSSVGLGATIELSGNNTIVMCGNVSAICSFRDARGTQWASDRHPLGLFSYSLYTTDQIAAYLAEYCPNGCSPNEYGKPGMPLKDAVVVSPSLAALWIKRSTAEDGYDELLALGTLPAALNQEYGAPSQVWLRVQGHANRLGLELTLVNKTATRFAESSFLTFAPETGDTGDGMWAMDKLGEWVSPLGVADGGSRGMHPVGQGVLYAQSESSPKVFFRTLDAGVVKFGPNLPFPTPMHADPDMSHGAHFLLHDNSWNTNYVFWWPYATPSNQDNLLFRFAIELVPEPTD